MIRAKFMRIRDIVNKVECALLRSPLRMDENRVARQRLTILRGMSNDDNKWKQRTSCKIFP